MPAQITRPRALALDAQVPGPDTRHVLHAGALAPASDIPLEHSIEDGTLTVRYGDFVWTGLRLYDEQKKLIENFEDAHVFVSVEVQGRTVIVDVMVDPDALEDEIHTQLGFDSNVLAVSGGQVESAAQVEDDATNTTRQSLRLLSIDPDTDQPRQWMLLTHDLTVCHGSEARVVTGKEPSKNQMNVVEPVEGSLYEKGLDGLLARPIRARYFFTVSDVPEDCEPYSTRPVDLDVRRRVRLGLSNTTNGQQCRPLIQQEMALFTQSGAAAVDRVGEVFTLDHTVSPWTWPWNENAPKAPIPHLMGGHQFGVYAIAGLDENEEGGEVFDYEYALGVDGDRIPSIWGSNKMLLTAEASARRLLSAHERLLTENPQIGMAFLDVDYFTHPCRNKAGSGRNIDHRAQTRSGTCADVIAWRYAVLQEIGDLVDGPVYVEGPRISSDHWLWYDGGKGVPHVWTTTDLKQQGVEAQGSVKGEGSAQPQYAVSQQAPLGTAWRRRKSAASPPLFARFFAEIDGQQLGLDSPDQLKPMVRGAWRRIQSEHFLESTCAGAWIVGQPNGEGLMTRRQVMEAWTFIRPAIGLLHGAVDRARQTNPRIPLVVTRDSEDGLYEFRTADNQAEWIVNRDADEAYAVIGSIGVRLPRDGWAFLDRPSGAFGMCAEGLLPGSPNGVVTFLHIPGHITAFDGYGEVEAGPLLETVFRIPRSQRGLLSVRPGVAIRERIGGDGFEALAPAQALSQAPHGWA